MAAFEAIWMQGNTVILVTHELDIAEHARRIVRMRDGRVESDQVNPAPKVATRPAAAEPA